jgi:hypothetical protein
MTGGVAIIDVEFQHLSKPAIWKVIQEKRLNPPEKEC